MEMQPAKSTSDSEAVAQLALDGREAVTRVAVLDGAISVGGVAVRSSDDEVTRRTTTHPVIAGTTEQLCRATAAHEPVGSSASPQLVRSLQPSDATAAAPVGFSVAQIVVTQPPVHRVITFTAPDEIVPGSTAYDVVSRFPGDPNALPSPVGIRAATKVDLIVAVVAHYPVGSSLPLEHVLPGLTTDQVSAPSADSVVVTASGADRVPSSSSTNNVAARARPDHVVFTGSPDHIRALRTDDRDDCTPTMGHPSCVRLRRWIGRRRRTRSREQTARQNTAGRQPPEQDNNHCASPVAPLLARQRFTAAWARVKNDLGLAEPQFC